MNSLSLPQELERSWREYEKLEGDVSLAKDNLLEQLEALGSPQVNHNNPHLTLWEYVVDEE